ncbi:stonustoxin subunit alpha-like isoform X1 [Sphaerodactylus townsendi]|uniref:stonustoxin subunit alpha-like isoform X1 n=2 Tax=Sphaerodactylus townsendi TaxID=933632 RepID=UPI002026534B|nr:stonustoxin subunit alpha-like isoform X1 [Sphaerodactylus townsendi]
MSFPVTRDNEVPALGRPLHLGMLYDRRSDTFVPGMTLWDPEILQKHVLMKPQPKTEFQVLASDNYDHLASALHLTLPLRASLLGGHVDLNGPARYLKDTKKSKNQVRVVLHSSITTRFEELTMTHLGPQNVTYPGVFDRGEATHVVTAVLYGAQAFFVFDREVASVENKDEIEKDLRSSVQSFCNKVHDGEETANRPGKEKTNTEDFRCTFYGDVALETNPITDPDAMKIYSALPKLLGEKGEKAVPVKVWLYPLVKLDPRAAQLVQEIGADLVLRAQSAVEQLSDCEGQSQDLLSTNDPSFPELREKVQRFQGLCKRHKETFQERVAKLLPSIRGGEQQEGALRDLLTQNEQSPFHSKWLSGFLSKKSAEVGYVKLFSSILKGVHVVPSASKLKEVLLDHQYKYVVSFTFTSLQTEEPYLLDLEGWLCKSADPAPSGSWCEKQTAKQWFEEEEVTRKARERVKSFADFAHLHQKKGKIRFIISSVPDVDNPGISIYLYKEGQLISRDFEPRLKPPPLAVGEVRHDSVQLRFELSVGGRVVLISSYCVEFKILGQESWTELNTVNGEETVVVRTLLPNTSYQFRCSLRNKPDLGESSSKSKVVKTLPISPPGKPQHSVVAPSAIRITWKSPSVIGVGVDLKGYKLKYAEAAAEGTESEQGSWTEVTVGKSCRCCRVAGLRPETSYRFLLVAVSSDGRESPPSEETVITTLRKEEKVSKLSSSVNIQSPRPGTMTSGEGRESELRIILVGRNGSGRKAVGNAILGRKAFESVPGANKTTAGKCRRGDGNWNGCRISVIDVPEIFDSDVCNQDFLVEIMHCVQLSKPGPHALVLVTQAGHFTTEDEAAVERVLDVFGMDSMRYMIVLFPQKEDSGGRSVQDHLPDNKALQELILKCGSRFCAFSLNAASKERMQQVSELMLMLQTLVCKNRGEPFVNALYTEASLTESKLRGYVAENRKARRNPGKVSEPKMTKLRRIASCVVAVVVLSFTVSKAFTFSLE